MRDYALEHLHLARYVGGAGQSVWSWAFVRPIHIFVWRDVLAKRYRLFVVLLDELFPGKGELHACYSFSRWQISSVSADWFIE